MKAIYFDMDGTIADLYSVEDWEKKLNSEDVTPYADAKPLCNMKKLNVFCETLKALGFTIGVISWTAKNGSPNYNKSVRTIKRAWLKEHFPCATEIHIVKYGTPKRSCAKIKNSFLIDDNAVVREQWGKDFAIDPCMLINALI